MRLNCRDSARCPWIGGVEQTDADGEFCTNYAAIGNKVLPCGYQPADIPRQPSCAAVEVHHSVKQQRKDGRRIGVKGKIQVVAIPEGLSVPCRLVSSRYRVDRVK
jgi:hypothetical protein